MGFPNPDGWGRKPNLREEARGRPCMVRIPNVCNFNPETTVLAHKGGYAGGKKGPDLIGAWACSDCHDVVDGRVPRPDDMSANEVKLYFYEGVFRTQDVLHKEGKL